MSVLATNVDNLSMPRDDMTVFIDSDRDIVTAREHGRTFASQLGFSLTESTLLATAVSELARNIVLYAKRGEIVLRALDDCDRKGILVIARDQGPGIPDLQRALNGGASRRGAMGLRVTQRLMDEFEIASAAGAGTTVAVKMWSRPSRIL